MIMKLLSMVAVMAFSLVATLGAQPIPLAPQNEWSYQRSDRKDEITTVRLVGSSVVTINCGRGPRRGKAWIDDGGYAYILLPWGMAIAAADSTLRVGSTPEPMLVVARDPERQRDGCGRFGFLGRMTVTTVAGTFADCLAYDDRDRTRIYIKPGVGIVREEHYKESPDRKGAAGEREMEWSRDLVRYSVAPMAETGDGMGGQGRRMR
jgi:hypothetical protein